MQIVHGLDLLPPGTRFAATLGIFDGVHAGHQRVLAETVRVARDLSASSMVVTFDPHPEAVLRGTQPPILCDPQERIERLAAAGIDIMVIQRFDRQFAAQSPAEFLQRLTSGRDMAALLMTPESAFGRDRAGTLAEVRRLGPLLGFSLVEVEQLALAGAPVSSTRLRELLAQGRLADVRRLLGRDYAVIGSTRAATGLAPGSLSLQFAHPVALPRPGSYAALASWGSAEVLRPRETSAATAMVTDAQPGQPEPAVSLLALPGVLNDVDVMRVEFLAVDDGTR
jgi:riboflavin kinase/FMN adenylyltransferase